MDSVSDPAKLKAEAAYNAAADHFDDGPLAFWDRYGRRTVERLSLAQRSSVLDARQRRFRDPSRYKCWTAGASHWDRLSGTAARYRAIEKHRGESVQRRLPPRRHDGAALYGCLVRCGSLGVLDLLRDRQIAQVRELWRVLRPGGKLAITTWGPRMFEAGSQAFWSAVKEVRPDLVATVSPWERITSPDALHQLLSDSGIEGAEVSPQDGQQPLQSAEDWWTIVLGSGYRWTVEQMNDGERARVKAMNLKTLRDSGTTSVETNVIYAVAQKV
jgi:hypothetical protein